MRYAQILYGRAHWIFESEEQPDFAPNIVLVNITDKPEIQEGWNYNALTGEFTAPNIPDPVIPEIQPSLEEMQAQTLLNTELLLIYKELETEASV